MNKFLLLLLISFAIYSTAHLFLNDVFIYLIGGVVGTIINVFSSTVSEAAFIFLWIVLLVLFIYSYHKARNSFLAGFLLILLFSFTYVVDALFYEFIINPPSSTTSFYLKEAIIIVLKSLILSSAIFYKYKKRIDRVSNTITDARQ